MAQSHTAAMFFCRSVQELKQQQERIRHSAAHSFSFSGDGNRLYFLSAPLRAVDKHQELMFVDLPVHQGDNRALSLLAMVAQRGPDLSRYLVAVANGT